VDVPWSLAVPHADVYLVGYGNRLPNDFTLETLAVLKRCTRIFGMPPLHAPDFGIPPMESLLEHYAPCRRRDKTYEMWVKLVLDAATADPPVAFATYGSAMAGVQAPHRILELAPQLGLSVHVTCAPSSFDGIWADLGLDPFDGVEIWEATAFLRCGVVPNTRANLFLPQISMLDVAGGLDPATLRIERSSTVSELRDHLLRFYPPDHEVSFATTDAGAAAHRHEPHVERVALRDLDGPGDRQASTLLVPRLGAAPAGAEARHGRRGEEKTEARVPRQTGSELRQ
jgi:uncharacterized protein YabN with tetrapyrrole methylase and pyrophosphatase domain